MALLGEDTLLPVSGDDTPGDASSRSHQTLTTSLLGQGHPAVPHWGCLPLSASADSVPVVGSQQGQWVGKEESRTSQSHSKHGVFQGEQGRRMLRSTAQHSLLTQTVSDSNSCCQTPSSAHYPARNSQSPVNPAKQLSLGSSSGSVQT